MLRPRLASPKTLALLPIRVKALMLAALPRAVKSSTEQRVPTTALRHVLAELPRRMKESRLTLDPIIVDPRMLVVPEPTLAAKTVLRLLPSLARERKDILLPIVSDSMIEVFDDTRRRLPPVSALPMREYLASETLEAKFVQSSTETVSPMRTLEKTLWLLPSLEKDFTETELPSEVKPVTDRVAPATDQLPTE